MAPGGVYGPAVRLRADDDLGGSVQPGGGTHHRWEAGERLTP
jgi:hypothetical protein